MKARRVFVMLEVETDIPLKLLRDPLTWSSAGCGWFVMQTSANVARKIKSKRKRARRKA